MKLNYFKTLFVAILVIFATTTYGETYSGTCGTNVNWRLDTSTGLLKITGTGEMNNSRPWKSYNSSIKSVEIAKGVTSIGEYAFDGCSGLTSVTIPNSVTSIGKYAFDGCSGLTSVTIPNSVTSIGDDAFCFCSGLTGVYITDLNAWCNIEFGASNANPLYYAHKLYLNGTLVRKLEIPEGVTTIKNYAFTGLNTIRSVTIPNSVTYIGYYAFYGCSGLTSVTIPNSVTSIGDYAFFCCNMTSVTIPNSVTSIGEWAFNYCSWLTSVTIGSGVSDIEDYAFGNCNNLKSIYSLAEYPPLIYSKTFINVDKTIPVYIPKGTKEDYEFEWSDFTNFIESDFTGIEDSNISATEIRVIEGNGIDICNYYGKLQVISLAGQVIKETYINGSAQITLPKGVYIVVTDNSSQKVVL